ncbi:hypothetical protein AAFF_G00385870 [Aldrovandia affinis]|uniref:SOWAHA-C winged helix-turn-helix domain-containing protein n=1 Tax=Aldrovandia affinis TaxID=143900 RepID=A0AAD7SF11_9TELE|nr:hypothetical protein AAFF_G00385870 [Aldrovandia affinis]
MGDLSEDMLLDYISKAGGKVKNAELLTTYKYLINHHDKQLRANYREQFKLIIDKIALIKLENGEKYLVLKKKYRQPLPERREKEEGWLADADSEKPADPALSVAIRSEGGEARPLPAPQEDPRAPGPGREPRPTAGAQERTPAPVSRCSGPAIAAPAAPKQERRTQEPHTSEACPPPATMETPSSLSRPNETPGSWPAVPESAAQRANEDTEPNWESESEDDGTDSREPPVVALDPVEKEWMQSAACGRLAHLIQLLKQEPSLAYKKRAYSPFGLGGVRGGTWAGLCGTTENRGKRCNPAPLGTKNTRFRAKC